MPSRGVQVRPVDHRGAPGHCAATEREESLVHVLLSAAHPLLAGASTADPLSASFWLASLGAFGVFAVVFAETGLLAGFFLPGDSLLFTAGLFCSARAATSEHLSLGWVLVAAVAGALIGAQMGFWLGRRGGRALLARTRNRWLRKGADRAGGLLDRYGYARAIVLARFIPVVRTILNPLAGMLDVPTRTFTIWQVIGGTIWAAGVTLAGYVLGASIPGIDQYLLPVIAVIVIASAVPVAIELIRERRSRHGRHRRTAPTPALPEESL
jgi:membrane-associated protein